MNEGFRLGRLFGIDITIDPSWILIFLLVTWSLAVGVFPRLQPEWEPILYWLIGISASLLFFISILAHELAHSLVARARGLQIKRITLFLFGGVSNLEREPQSASTEFLMAIVGPAASISLGYLFLFLSGQEILNPNDTLTISGQFIAQLSPLQTLLLWLGSVNIIVGIFNLIPGFPLDGGRILRSIVWSITNNLKVATRVAAFAGQSFGYLFILIGISIAFGITVPFFGTGLINGLWIAFIGWFLSAAAGRSYQQVLLRDFLENVTVSKIMQKKISPVPPDISISQLVDKYMIGTDRHVFPVTVNSKLEGIICLEDIQKISREQWDKRKVREIMTPYKQLEVVKPDEEASEVLDKITRRGIGQVPVVKDKILVGMLSRRDILLWLILREKTDELKEISNSI